MKSYGTPDNPWPELPPAASLYSVHWSGLQGVQWFEAAYLHRGGLILPGDLPRLASARGTLSVWFKFNTAEPISLLSGDLYAYMLDVLPGGGIGTLWSDESGPVSVRFVFAEAATSMSGSDPPLDGMWAMEDIDSSLSTGGDLKVGTGIWFHVYAEWDSTTGYFVLKVNNRPATTAVISGSEFFDPVLSGDPSFEVPWWQDPLSPSPLPEGQDTIFFWMPNALQVDSRPKYAVADFWLDIERNHIGIDKFIDTATGTPRSLGKDGELPTGKKPAFFFHRQGEPKTFCTNRGYAGDFTLVGSPPVSEPTAPRFTPATTGSP